MAVEDELRTVLLEILRIGILNIRSAGWNGDPERCALEADHIHNLPEIVRAPSLDLANSYNTVHRPDFMKQVADSSPFEPHWHELEEVLARMRRAKSSDVSA